MNDPKEEDVRLDFIDFGDRLRDIDQNAVVALSHSINERGLLTRVKLRAKGDGRYKGIYGAHRFAAVQMLGWVKIPATIVQCSDEEARLDEIDENLYRQELTPFDQANFLEERRRIWEQMHGNVKRGGDRRSKAQIAPLIGEVGRGAAFIKETAAKFGLTPDVVKRALTRKGQIVPRLWEILRGTDAARNGSLLDKIRKLDLEEQLAVADVIKERGCTVQYAIQSVARPSEVDIEMRDFDALRLAWKRACVGAQEKFRAFVENNP